MLYSSLIFIIFYYLYLLQPITAIIIGGAVIPHGDFAYDPSLIHNANNSLLIHNASVALGETLISLQPDIIFLITPHGIALTNDFAISLSSNGTGYATIGDDLHNASYPVYNVPMNFPLAPTLSTNLVNYLRNQHPNITGILPWADSEGFPLRWGEIIPLTFLSSLINNSYTSTTPEVLIWSQPLRRYNDSVSMIPELLEIGDLLYNYFENLSYRTLIIVSADLAHTHLNPVQPYPPCECATTFDNACTNWAITLNSSSLLIDAAAVVDDALSCGYTGMVILHGIISNRNPKFIPQLLAYAAPTYYGMLVASFLRSTAE